MGAYSTVQLGVLVEVMVATIGASATGTVPAPGEKTWICVAVSPLMSPMRLGSKGRFPPASFT